MTNVTLNDNAKSVLAILAKDSNALFTQTGSDTAQSFVTISMPSADFNLLAEKLLEILK